jgi:hypothetical protein
LPLGLLQLPQNLFGQAAFDQNDEIDIACSLIIRTGEHTPKEADLLTRRDRSGSRLMAPASLTTS